MKHEFSATFEREKFNGKFVGKGDLHNIVNCLCNLQSHNVFQFIIYYRLFNVDGKDTDQPHLDGSPNPVLIRENNLNPISHPV